jgi:hypothetical protein
MEQIKQQTAVEWLEQEYKKWYRKGNPIILKLIKQAKQMEKEQIMDAWYDGDLCGAYNIPEQESYYDKIYGKQ